MKKALSYFLALATILLPVSTTFGQKNRYFGKDQGEKIAIAPAATSAREEGVEFGAVQAIVFKKGVYIEWQMRIEKEVIGYYIHRIDSRGDNVINPDILFGSPGSSSRQPTYGEQYAFIDAFGTSASVYYLQVLDLDGKRVNSTIFAPGFSRRVPVLNPGIPSNAVEPGTIESQSLQNQSLKIPKEVRESLETSSNLVDPATHAWVMSRPGVRIDVKTEGIYRVTFAQLQNAGLNTSDPKTDWQLFLNGVEQAISIDETGQFVEFFGKGVDTVESDIQGYFLVLGDSPGKRIQTSVARPSTSTVIQRSYQQTFQMKERINYLNTILNGPAENFWGRAILSTGIDVSFELKGVDFNVANSTLEVKVQGLSGGAHTVRVTLNGQLLDPITGVSQFPLSATLTIPTSLLKDADLGQGSNVLNLASIASGSDSSIFDSLKVSFSRKQLADQNILKAYALNNRKATLTGFSSANVRVFDISNENEVRLMTNLAFQNSGGSFGTELPAARGKIYYAVEDLAVKAPFAVVAKDTEVLASNQLGADLIIITYKDFVGEAQTWANYRAGQGTSAKVVNVDEVFNEFNYGVSSSEAIRTFLQFANQNWNPHPHFVLLIGDASFDPRNYQGNGNFNFVPTRIVTTVFDEAGSDESLADFNNDGLSEMAIGRIPARLSSNVTSAFSKTTNWEANLPADPLSRGSLFVSHWDTATPGDPNDPETLFQEISKRLKAELPAGAPTTLLNTLSNSKSDVLSAMNGPTNSGKYIVNFAGHGSIAAWVGTNFFWSGDVASLTNHNSEAIYTSLTCLNGVFLSPTSPGLSENLLNWENGGAVAVWSSTGKTTPDMQEIMAKRFYHKIGDGSIPRLGDLIMDAKLAVVGGADVRLSWSLLGDPMLKVR